MRQNAAAIFPWARLQHVKIPSLIPSTELTHIFVGILQILIYDDTKWLDYHNILLIRA
jgi:hypothetical protein